MKIYAVGGSIRDQLLGRPVKDKDFVVIGATPKEMIDLGFTQVGSDFPVFLDAQGQEHALARQERKVGPGYHGFETHYDPSVTLEDDLIRRDLTVNSMARDLETNELIDPFDGQEDLQKGILRHVSEAFAEDPLRVLRVARFAARYNFAVAPETRDLMKELVVAGELDHLTPERVWSEFERAMMEDFPNAFFWTLDQCDALGALFPELGRGWIYSGKGLSTAALRHADKLTRLALAFPYCEWDGVSKMLYRLKSPSDVYRITMKLHKILSLVQKEVHLPGAPGSWDATSDDVFEVLKFVDAFRRPKDLFTISSVINYLGNPRLIDRMDAVLIAFRNSSKVTFATLTEDQQKTLKGKAVGEAIGQMRIDKIKEVI